MIMSKTDEVRKIITSGRHYRNADIAAEVGCHNTVLHRQQREMESLGYQFDRDAEARFFCVNPRHKPSAADEQNRARWRRDNNPLAYGQKPSSSDSQSLARQEPTRDLVAAAAQPPAPTPPTPPPTPSFATFKSPVGPLGVPGFESTEAVNFRANGLEATPPRLGGRVEVYAMVMLDDGTLRLGIQSGETRWVADVVAEVSRAS